MENKKTVTKFFSLFPVFTFSVFALTNIETIINNKLISPIIIGVCLLCVMAIALISNMKRKLSRIISIIVISIITIAGIIAFLSICNFTLNSVQKMLLRFNNAPLILLLLVALSATMIISLLSLLLHKTFITRIICLVAVISVIVIYSVFEKSISKLCTISAVCYIMIGISYLYFFIAYKGNEREERNSSLSFLIVPVLIISIVVALIPAPDKPFEWPVASKIINTVSDFVGNVSFSIYKHFASDPYEYSLSMTGYSDSADLGGNIKDSNDRSLTVSTPYVPSNSLYLIGTVKDSYSKNKWSNKNDYKAYQYNEYQLDYLEYLYALYRSNMISDTKLMNTKVLEISYNHMYTSTIFYPLKTYELTVPDTKNKIDLSRPSICFYNKPGNNPFYKIRYIYIDYADKAFQELIDSQQGYSYASDPKINYQGFKESVCKRTNVLESNIPDNLEDILSKRYTEIKNCYADNSDISPRIKELAKNITKDCNDDYSKLKAIEHYLNTYEYTKSPGNPPKDKDTIEYFLFDSKRGYCTYFASAMTLLARSCDIPARYVQGFSSDLGLTDNPGEYAVSSNEAHAWTEAYIKGIGWVPFEPTSAYVTKLYKNAESVNIIYTDTDNLKQKDSSFVRIKKAVKNIVLIPLAVILCMAFIAAIVCLVVLLIRNRKCLKKYNQSSTKDKFIYMFRYYMWCTGLLSFPMLEGETLCEYSKRCRDNLTSDKAKLDTVIDKYMKIRYGNGEISEYNLKSLVELCKEAEVLICEKKGKHKFKIRKILRNR